MAASVSVRYDGKYTTFWNFAFFGALYTGRIVRVKEAEMFGFPSTATVMTAVPSFRAVIVPAASIPATRGSELENTSVAGLVASEGTVWARRVKVCPTKSSPTVAMNSTPVISTERTVRVKEAFICGRSLMKTEMTVCPSRRVVSFPWASTVATCASELVNPRV